MRTWTQLFASVLLALSFLLLSVVVAEEKTMTPRPITVDQRADFRISLKKLLINEGFYSNHKKDYGGETYRGVARRVSPEWKGWKLIDEYKKTHDIKWNDSIPGLVNWYVTDYYLDIWVKEGFYDIEDQLVADYLFDTRVNCNIGSLLINRTLRKDFKCTVSLTNQFSYSTAKHVNHLPAKKLLTALAYRRAKFYNNIVASNPDQKIWLEHWMSRVIIQ